MNPAAIVKPCSLKSITRDNIYCVYDQQQVSDFQPEMFLPGYWQQQNAVTGSAQGRGTTWFIEHQQKHWVLRHYYRGGLVSKVISDSYWFTSNEQTRAAREFNLLLKLQELGLPAPTPIAYRVVRTGMSYRADLITERIENASDLVALLTKQPLTDELWFNIGQVIKAFHQAGIYHHDLNAHNILLDGQQKIWLIDFDHGQQRTIKEKWQQGNLERLHRSFNKELGKLPVFHWQESNWQALLNGYRG